MKSSGDLLVSQVKEGDLHHDDKTTEVTGKIDAPLHTGGDQHRAIRCSLEFFQP